MSNERQPHLSKKRQSVTIEGEATGENIGEASVNEPVSEVTDAIVEPIAEMADTTPFGRPAEEAVERQETLSKTSAEKTAPRRSSGAYTGGIIGAALALAGAFGLQAYGLLPQQNAGDSVLSDRLSTLESGLASGTNSEGERVAALSAEITALKDSVAALSQAAGDSSVADRVTALEQSASMVVPATNSADVTALASRLATLESKASDGSMNEVLTTTKNALTTEIDGLKSELAALKSQMTAQASEPGLAAAVAATALRAAVDRGGTFGAELENLAAVQPEAPAIAALREFAASGVPTRQDLAAEFETAAQAMMAASEPVDPNAGLLTKLLDSAKGLIKVRPIGVIDGDTAAAKIARMGEAITKGDDALVATEFAALPAPSRDAGAAFIARFNARAEADRLIAEAVRAASPKAGG